ncbi:MAG: hypothetical protein ACPGWR_26340 [Ardenticatenaceae bacterium]
MLTLAILSNHNLLASPAKALAKGHWLVKAYVFSPVTTKVLYIQSKPNASYHILTLLIVQIAVTALVAALGHHKIGEVVARIRSGN